MIDSNNGANNQSKYYISVSNNWKSSTNVRGYYNTGYWVAPTESVSDAAKFYFKESSSQCYKVEAWWTSASDRPSSVTFIAQDGNDRELGRASVNQQINGGKWNNLGTWRFGSGEIPRQSSHTTSSPSMDGLSCFPGSVVTTKDRSAPRS